MTALSILVVGCSREKLENFFKPEKKEAEEQVEEEVVVSTKKIFKRSKPQEIFVIADFNSGEKPNKIGGDFGAWDKDPLDFTQTAFDSFISTIRHGNKGYCVQVMYDVISDNAAYNGFWMKLNELDASEYNNIHFWVKGDELRGYTQVFKLELKNSQGEIAKVYITGITDHWQEIVLPLSKFVQLSDFSSLSELVIVFEDRIATAKEGAIYIDDIYLSK